MTAYEIISVLSKMVEDNNPAVITAIHFGKNGTLSAAEVSDIIFNEFVDFLEERSS